MFFQLNFILFHPCLHNFSIEGSKRILCWIEWKNCVHYKIWVNKSANNMRHFYSRIDIRKWKWKSYECKDYKCKREWNIKRNLTTRQFKNSFHNLQSFLPNSSPSSLLTPIFKLFYSFSLFINITHRVLSWHWIYSYFYADINEFSYFVHSP